MAPVVRYTTHMLDVKNTTRLHTPRVPFERIMRDTLGAQYELSLVLIGDTLARRLNTEHKGKTNPTNVLSFPYASAEGEIFINLRRAKRDAHRFGHTYTQHVAFLFIHGCLHLAGMAHSPAMEKKEETLLKKYLA